jgi:hypothetical protein
MRCPSRVRVSILPALFICLVGFGLAGCSGGNPQAGAIGTGGAANAPFAIEIAQTYLTLENRTGGPLVGGQMEIIPGGVLPAFKATLPRLENGSRRDFRLNQFIGNDGTPFSRSIRARRVKVTAKDPLGKTFEYEVPFN